jgi:hypothetical protein
MNRKIIQAFVLALASLAGVSCMTTYDAYGRPVQSVDPGVAVAGAAAAGIIGYSAGRDNNRSYRRPHVHHPRHVYRPAPPRYYRGPVYR